MSTEIMLFGFFAVGVILGWCLGYIHAESDHKRDGGRKS